LCIFAIVATLQKQTSFYVKQVTRINSRDDARKYLVRVLTFGIKAVGAIRQLSLGIRAYLTRRNLQNVAFSHNHFPLLAAIYFTMDSTNSIELKPYDSEQQLYVAACIIQNAYRHYRQRMKFKQLLEKKQYNAAALIQSYYRRYKQHCHFKRIQRAAILIQKQFRKYRSVRGKITEEDQCDIRKHSYGTMNTLLQLHSFIISTKRCAAYSKNCITANDVLFWKQTLAAMRIQNAFSLTIHLNKNMTIFRIHLKRHSAARYIGCGTKDWKNPEVFSIEKPS
ncbi:Calmodulin-binding transcription activator 1, partial [Trichinella sp. T8]